MCGLLVALSPGPSFGRDVQWSMEADSAGTLLGGDTFHCAFGLRLCPLQEMARNFARTEMIPKAAEFDKSGKYPQEVFKKGT